MAQGQYRRPVVSTIGRWEWIADIAMATLNTQYALPTQGGQIPNERFMFGLNLQYEGRIANAGTNNPTGQQADAQYALLDTIFVQGTHKIRGQSEQFINVRGPDMREWTGIYRARFPFNQNSLSNTASANNDIRYIIEVPFVPLGVSGGQQIDYLLDAPNYDSLKLLVNYGDDQSVFTYGTRGVPTFTAFGSASGNPRTRVYGVFAQAGPSAFAGFVPGRPWRWFDEQNATAPLVTTSTGARIWNLVRGNRIRSLLLKTGVKSTAVAAGNNSYNTLSNTIFSGNLKIFKGTNRIIRYYQDFFGIRENGAQLYGFTPDNGYALEDFAGHGALTEALDLSGAIVGAQGDIDTYIQSDTTGASNQAAVLMYEELRYYPQSQ